MASDNFPYDYFKGIHPTPEFENPHGDFPWWNISWKYRRFILEPHNDAGGYYDYGNNLVRASGRTPVMLWVYLDKYVAEGKVNDDYSDVRIIFQSGVSNPKYFNVPYYIASGLSPQKIYFFMQNDVYDANPVLQLHDGGDGWAYYLYYGNDSTPDTEKPEKYINFNNPLAPFHVQKEWTSIPGHPESGHRDLMFYRLNDDPSTMGNGPKDETGNTYAISGCNGDACTLAFGVSGYLDSAVFFDGTVNNFIDIFGNNSNVAHYPSSMFVLDFWYADPDPYRKMGTSMTVTDGMGYQGYHPQSGMGSDIIIDRSGFLTVTSIEDASNFLDDVDPIRCAVSGQLQVGTGVGDFLEAYDPLTDHVPTNGDTQIFADVASDWYTYEQANMFWMPDISELLWRFVRFCYRGDSTAASSVFSLYDNYDRTLINDNGNFDDSINDIYKNGKFTIGQNASHNNNVPFKGIIEQVRLSTFPLDQIDDPNSSIWLPTKEIATKDKRLYCFPSGGEESISISEASGEIGGCVSTEEGIVTADAREFGGYIYTNIFSSGFMLGGYFYSLPGEIQDALGGGIYGESPMVYQSGHFGGAVNVFKVDTIATIGGFFNPSPEFIWKKEKFGGYMFTNETIAPNKIGGHSLGTWEGRNDIYVDSLCRTLVEMNSDSTHKQGYNIDSKLKIYKICNNDFNSKINVSRKDYSVFNAEATVINLRKNPYVKIISSGIDGLSLELTASGYMFNKNDEMVDNGINRAYCRWSDGNISILENAQESGSIFKFSHDYSFSGIYSPIVTLVDINGRVGSDYIRVDMTSSGTDVPRISLSGEPRSGYDQLDVDFSVDINNTIGAYNLYWDFANGLTYYNNSEDMVTSYNMPGNYIPYVMLKDERGIVVTDTLLLGYNR